MNLVLFSSNTLSNLANIKGFYNEKASIIERAYFMGHPLKTESNANFTRVIYLDFRILFLQRKGVIMLRFRSVTSQENHLVWVMACTH